MSDWTNFFMVEAEAAAALGGLVFVGVSINLDKIVSNPGYGLTGRVTVDCVGGGRIRCSRAEESVLVG
jgi:hypothetical protein